MKKTRRSGVSLTLNQAAQKDVRFTPDLQKQHDGFTQGFDSLSLEGEDECVSTVVRGKVNKENLMGTPSSALQASSPSRGKWGFTLIELLVVVLIIGILAAVALPQYKLAVTKSRVTTMLPILKAIAQANVTYFLENGSYSTDVRNLDISMPGECINKLYGQQWKCGDYYMIDNSGGQWPMVHYCPNNNDTLGQCTTNRDFTVLTTPTFEFTCKPFTNLGTKVCNSLALH